MIQCASCGKVHNGFTTAGEAISPIAPARVRILLLPAGRMVRSRFVSFVQRLQSENVVRLCDISPVLPQDQSMFSPLAFPSGGILYSMTTFDSSVSQQSLSPYEMFREPLIVFAIADGASAANDEDEMSESDDDSSDQRPEDLDHATEHVYKQFPGALLVRLVVFDYDLATSAADLPADAVRVPSLEQSRSTTIKTIMCDISASFLSQMASYAKSIQELPVIDLPSSTQKYGVLNALRHQRSHGMMRASSYSTQYSRSSSPARSVGHEQADDPALKRENFTPNTGEEAVSGESHFSGPSNVSNSKESLQSNGLRRIASEPQNSMSISTSVINDRKAIQTGSMAAVMERNKLRSRIRQTLIIGSLYMQVGRWPDAFRELVDGATKARASGDHLWHAKGLENIIVTILLQAWAGLDFHVPAICMPNTEKLSRQRNSSISSITSGLAAGLASGITGSSSTPPDEAARFKALQNLSTLLPDMLSMILEIYSRAADTAGEHLPSFSYCETVIRFSYLLSIMHRSGGILNRKALKSIVLNIPLRSTVDTSAQSWTSWPPKTTISAMLFKGYPSSTNSSMSLHEKTGIYAGIAAVLSFLGLHRKRALVVREMLALLIPGLIQARKVGAAEVGIHPAAGLAALQSLDLDGAAGTGLGSTKGSFSGLLFTLCRSYGIDLSPEPMEVTPSSSETGKATGEGSREIEALLWRIRRDSTYLSFGGLGLKVDILRLCANFSESLPDFKLVMAFTSTLLKTIGSHSAVKGSRESNYATLSRDEQTRLVNKLVRTLEVVRPESVHQIEAGYWDRFLVRGVRAADARPPKVLVKHTRANMKRFSRNRAVSVAQGTGPFIHNALSRSIDSTSAGNVLVAGDQSEFIILLQNVYDFDLVIEDISLITEGPTLRSKRQPVVIGPRCIGEILVAGIVGTSGELRITGCRARVQGCRLEDFLIVSESWKPRAEVKVKHTGLPSNSISKRKSATAGPEERVINEKLETQFLNPKYDIVSMLVLEPQPLLAVVSTTLSQSMLAILDGETHHFSVQVRNVAEDVDVDFFHVSFEQSILTEISANDEPDMSAGERYDHEYENLYRQSLRWVRDEGEETESIGAGATSIVRVEVLGHLKLSESVVKIDYAKLGCRLDDVKGSVFTRQLSLPFLVTVRASIRIRNIQVLPIRHTAGGSAFVLLLDMENEWIRPLEVSVKSNNELLPLTVQGTSKKELIEVIQPRQIIRLALPMDRLHVQYPYAPIPHLVPGQQKQFIFDAEQNAQDQRADLELFWYREALLSQLTGLWREVDSNRAGTIDLRVIRLDRKMLNIVRRDPVNIEVDVIEASEGGDETRHSEAEKFKVVANAPVTMNVTVRNNDSEEIQALVHFEFTLSGHTLSETDLADRVAWTGVLHQPLRVLRAEEQAKAALGLIFMSAGTYEVKTSVYGLYDDHHPDGRAAKGLASPETRPLLGITRRAFVILDDDCCGDSNVVRR